MKFVSMVGAAALLALGACSTLTGGEQNAPAPAFNAAACTQKDFVIYFDEGSAELTEEARRIIDLQARDIRGCTIDGVRIIGLSDQEEGVNAESSRQISVRRAEVLAEYLATRASWPRSRFELLATGARGATTAEGLDVPVRNRARIIVASSAP